MRTLSSLGGMLLTAAVLAACSDQVPHPTDTNFSTASAADAQFSRGAAASARVPAAKNFVAPMDPGQEVHDVVSNATGNTVFQLRDDGLHYKLIVANIRNVTMAHIHLAPRGVNGPVVVWLYPDSPPAELIPGRSQGILAEGVITSADLVGPLAGQTLDDLLEEMRAGNTYVNVHTLQYPPGEIRGQIFAAGPGRQIAPGKR